MALLRQTNPIVTTYPMYIVPHDYDYDDIFEWLIQHTKHAGIGRAYDADWVMCYRIFAKLNPQIETLFILKFEAIKIKKQVELLQDDV